MDPIFKKSKNMNDENVRWIGDHYQEDVRDIKELQLRFNSLFYKKCAVDHLIIELGDFVLIANESVYDPTALDKCNVARIVHLYEDIYGIGDDNCRALVQWYARYQDLPKTVFQDGAKIFDEEYELIEDSRFSGDIAISSIFDKTNVAILDNPNASISSILNMNKSKGPITYFCRYKLAPVSRKYYAYPLSETSPKAPKKTPSKVSSITTPNKLILSKLNSPCGKWTVRCEKLNAELCELGKENETNNSPIKKSLSSDHKDSISTLKRRTLEGQLVSDFNKKMIEPESAKRKSRLPTLDEVQTLKVDKHDRNSTEYSTPIKKSRRSSLHKIQEELKSERTPSSRKSLNLTPSKCANLRTNEDLPVNISTPTSKVTNRRKSILKTPSQSDAVTPKKSIKFSKKVQELLFEKDARKKSERSSIRDDEPETNLQIARKQLHVSAVPKTLPCREKEYQQIYNFLEGKILDGIGGCIYVSGVPGTGKTATTTEVVKALKLEAEADNLPNFDFVEINGMRVTEPRRAYVEIYKQLTGKTVNWENAHTLLNKRFSTPSPRKITTVLVIDELDILCNKRQDVVYNLLNWPTLDSAKLVVITIANTMDLPERVLQGKVASRLGLTRLTFQPYNHKQLQEIVSSRLSGLQSFNIDAIQLVARKVAALSGDARRALDICRRATEIAENGCEDKSKASVSMLHVQQSLTEMITSNKVQAIRSCSKLERCFLEALCMEITRTGVEEQTFYGIYTQLQNVCTLQGVIMPTTGKALQVCSRLGASRFLICEHSRMDLYQKILLNISQDDFYYATQLNPNGDDF